MTDKTVVITGGSDGIGEAAARHAVRQGHRVVIVGRNPDKTRAVGAELGIDHHIADYADLEQVRALGRTLLESYPRIDVLANNAGGLMGDREVTVDGYEKTFQVNHLGGFLLTNILLPTLIESSAKVLQTSSVGAKAFGKIDIDDLQNERKYSPMKAYGDSKLANILFTRELDRRYRDQGISAAAFHPGNVSTSFGNYTNQTFIKVIYKSLKWALISPEKGADTLNWLIAEQPGAVWEPGKYYVKRKPAKTSPQADDAQLAAQLWERSAALTALVP
ncbi:SDR family NAD(P)-dependent oxidoreductase [Nocardia harenae]|uniref:SDR family NAD(P)-dependent oxidoreductase n=1 Tax=Nocardia harenae TaxID=358707 RepID=UPI000829AB29|nr:SDR family NAD(P)-dependent oxidoreductase [Nocardia harenae]